MLGRQGRAVVVLLRVVARDGDAHRAGRHLERAVRVRDGIVARHVRRAVALQLDGRRARNVAAAAHVVLRAVDRRAAQRVSSGKAAGCNHHRVLRQPRAVVLARGGTCRDLDSKLCDFLLEIIGHIVVGYALGRDKCHINESRVSSRAVRVGGHIGKGTLHGTCHDGIAGHKAGDGVAVGRGGVVALERHTVVGLDRIQFNGQRGGSHSHRTVRGVARTDIVVVVFKNIRERIVVVHGVERIAHIGDSSETGSDGQLVAGRQFEDQARSVGSNSRAVVCHGIDILTVHIAVESGDGVRRGKAYRSGIAVDFHSQVVGHNIVVVAVRNHEICRHVGGVRGHAVNVNSDSEVGTRHRALGDVVGSRKARDCVAVGRGGVVAHKDRAVVCPDSIQFNGQLGRSHAHRTHGGVHCLVCALHIRLNRKAADRVSALIHNLVCEGVVVGSVLAHLRNARKGRRDLHLVACGGDGEHLARGICCQRSTVEHHRIGLVLMQSAVVGVFVSTRLDGDGRQRGHIQSAERRVDIIRVE